jgi:hypothetical protein
MCVSFLFQIKVRTYKKESCYAKVKLLQTIQSVECGIGVSEVSRVFNIPWSTIKDNLKNINSKRNSGGQTIFTPEQETSMKTRILYLCSRGFPVTVDQCRKIAYTFASTLKRRKKLQNIGMPQSWKLHKKLATIGI